MRRAISLLLLAVGSGLAFPRLFAATPGLEWELWRLAGQPGSLEEARVTTEGRPADEYAVLPAWEIPSHLGEPSVMRLRARLTEPFRGNIEVQAQGEVSWSATPPDSNSTTLGGTGVVDLPADSLVELSFLPDAAGGLRVTLDGRTLDVQAMSPVRSEGQVAEERFRRGSRLKYLRAYDREKHMSRSFWTGAGPFLARETLWAARALLQSPDPEDWKEAALAIDRVLPSQQTDPSKPHFGNWPTVVDDPSTFNDLNWREFNSEALLLMLLEHPERLPAETKTRMVAALERAVPAIIRRNIDPHYTNIAAIGSFVCLVAGQTFGWPEAQEYGAKLLGTLHRLATEEASFAEYSSPTYTPVTIQAFAALRRWNNNTELQPKIENLYRAAWLEVLQQYHPPTRQWAGPMSRHYAGFFTPVDLIQEGSGNRIFFGKTSWTMAPLPIPEDLLPLLLDPQLPVERRRTILKRLPGRVVDRAFHYGDAPDLVATTFLHPAFALGSANRSDFWSQRRPLLAQWGPPDAPNTLRVRVLSDGKDAAFAQFFSAQSGGRALGGVAFADDGSVDHPYKKGVGAFRSSDLRLRIEVLGPSSAELLRNHPTDENIVTLPVAEGWVLDIRPLGGKWNTEPARVEIVPLEDGGAVDLVFHHGGPVDWDLPTMAVACAGFALEFRPADTPLPSPPTARTADGRMILEWENMHVAFPASPASLHRLHHGVSFEEPAAAKPEADKASDGNSL